VASFEEQDDSIPSLRKRETLLGAEKSIVLEVDGDDRFETAAIVVERTSSLSSAITVIYLL